MRILPSQWFPFMRAPSSEAPQLVHTISNKKNSSCLLSFAWPQKFFSGDKRWKQKRAQVISEWHQSSNGHEKEDVYKTGACFLLHRNNHVYSEEKRKLDFGQITVIYFFRRIFLLYLKSTVLYTFLLSLFLTVYTFLPSCRRKIVCMFLVIIKNYFQDVNYSLFQEIVITWKWLWQFYHHKTNYCRLFFRHIFLLYLKSTV